MVALIAQLWTSALANCLESVINDAERNSITARGPQLYIIKQDT